MKIFVLKKEQVIILTYLIIIVIGLLSSIYNIKEAYPTFYMPASKKTVMIDAGHGGPDPGATSGKVREKNININIATKLQQYLEMGDAYTLMTRIDDNALSSDKQTDMYRRKALANSSKADIYVSIHQNIFSDSNVKGAQVFYFGGSKNSQRLAECIQSEIKKVASPSNKMEPAPNTSYYVLRQTTMPSVIVECGFLSNSGERWKLTTDEYQDCMAWAIYMGIIRYFQEEQQD